MVKKDAARLRAEGDAHMEAGKPAEAVVAYRQAAVLNNADPPTWWGLGCAALALEEHAEAVEAFRTLALLLPRSGECHHNLGKALFELGQVDEALAAFRQALACLPGDARAVPLGMIATIIPGSAQADHRAVRAARQAWAAVAFPPAPPRRGVKREAGKPLRLGYVSAFFSRDNWMKPVWGLLNHHDRNRFEIHLFSDGPASAIKHGLVLDARDGFHDITGLSNDAAARLVEESAIDLLVDLNAYSKLSRLPLFARRPAPVQAAWFNMFATSGLPCFDYLLGDTTVSRPEEDAEYTERVIRLAGSYLTFSVLYRVPDVAPLPCLAGRPFTLGCLAPHYKVTPEVIAAFARILHACPAARLLLKSIVLGKEANRRFVLDLFAKHAITPGRLDLEGPADHYQFLTAYERVDLALDTFPYNGGTTTMEALWQGVPVLTFHGDRWAGRISASLLHAAGLDEFVGKDEADFVQRACAWCAEPACLANLRTTMRERLQRASVCDVQGFCREIEAAYLRMIE